MNFQMRRLKWLQVIIFERFGIVFDLVAQGETLFLTLNDSDGLISFDCLQPDFYFPSSTMPCTWWDAEAQGWDAVLSSPLPAPGAKELPTPLIEITDGKAVIHYDILGLTYWMLSRQEEVGRTDLDEHGRFPATSSHAFKHGYLERPIVDEWLNILGQVIQRVWPRLELKTHRFNIKVSHDVDFPSRYGFRSMKRLIRAIAGDLVKRRDFKSALTAPWIRLNSGARLHPADPFNTFDWIMDVFEAHGLTSAFYFMCGRTDKGRDGDYEIEHPAIRDLMRRIHARGHEIGLHPSYNTYQRPDLIAAEADRLRRVCHEEGIKQDVWGGRMHYLRWEHPTTMRGWQQAGMTYDSTLGYADMPGFRCGTCFEYPAFDPLAERQLALRIRPLIVMECTILADRYMGLGTGVAAYNKFSGFRDTCMKVNGMFTMLWHNSNITDREEIIILKNLVWKN